MSASAVFTGGTPAVRTRFAPSPTGMPHIGGFRTVIFSWLLARHGNGQFLVRIEDTDQKRTVEGAVVELLEGLRWLGTMPDEGPEVGGPVGPYFQSQRTEHYDFYARQLLDNGHAYRCFCTRERLEALRAEQQARHEPTTGYDRLCRRLSADEVAAKLADNLPFVVRLKVPETGTTVSPDILRGEIVFQNSTLEDAILLKSDGFPTYHFANVVDDHEMGITHVLRGDDWLPSAPLHVLLYQFLGWQMPITAQVPNVLGKDGKKLSKRHGAESILVYRDRGYLPEAIINYLSLLGWSYDDKTDILSIPQLIASFSLERVHTAGAVYDPDRLDWMNGVYIRQLPIEDLVERALPYIERPQAEGGLPDTIARPLDRAYLARVLKLDQERMKVLSEAPFLAEFFFGDALDYDAKLLIGKGLDAAQSRDALQRAYDLLAGLPDWEAAAMEQPMRDLATELGLKPGPLFMGVRVAVTGRNATPPLFETLEVLGRERSLARLADGIARLAS
ncbi:MAG TPA: glutamate--tRNA ligase [Ktedonobacterales bacterium]|nr:glutamate--tRNA ligase [Ktedonobacterales bacterium]